MSFLGEIVNKYGLGESVGIKVKKEKKNPYVAACENKLLYLYGENDALKNGINDVIGYKTGAYGEKFSFGVPDWEINNDYKTRRQMRKRMGKKYGEPKITADKDVYGDGAVTIIYDDQDIVKTMISTRGTFRGKWFTDRYNLTIGEPKEEFVKKASKWFYDKGDYFFDPKRGCKVYFENNQVSKIVVDFDKKKFLQDRETQSRRNRDAAFMLMAANSMRH